MTLDPTRRWALLALLLGTVAPGSAQELTLTEALDATLGAHPALMAAEARVDGARAGADAARAARVPSVVAGGSADRFQEPMVVAPLHGFDPTNPPDFDRTLVQGRLALQYTLFDGGERGARIRGADALAEASRATRAQVEMAVLEAASTAYLALASAREVAAAAATQVQALESELERARRHLAEGTAARVDVLRAEAATLDAGAQLATARAGVEAAEAALGRLMAVPTEQLHARSLRPPSERPGATRAEALDDSPRILAARRAVAAAEARAAQERAARLPSLQAGGGLLSFGSGAGDFVTEWQAGVRLSWPVFTGGARRASIRQAEADVRRAREELRLAELDEGTTRDEARAALVSARARAAAHEAAVVQWEEVARIETLSLSEGAGIQSDFLRAQAALLAARAGLARARNEIVLARIRHAHAEGTLSLTWLDDVLEDFR